MRYPKMRIVFGFPWRWVVYACPTPFYSVRVAEYTTPSDALEGSLRYLLQHNLHGWAVEKVGRRLKRELWLDAMANVLEERVHEARKME